MNYSSPIDKHTPTMTIADDFAEIKQLKVYTNIKECEEAVSSYILNQLYGTGRK